MNPILKTEISQPAPTGMVKVELTIERSKLGKIQAFMQSETWEKAEQIRQANQEECINSLEHCVNLTFQHIGTSGGRVFAQFLASLYNGTRVKADVSGISSLDMANFEHLMNVIRLCKETHREPHDFFENGNEIFERIISDWKLEKKTRARS